MVVTPSDGGQGSTDGGVGPAPAALQLSAATVLSQVPSRGPYSAADVSALASADLGVLGTELTESVVSDDGEALCFSVTRGGTQANAVRTVVVGSGSRAEVWDRSCPAALPVAVPALAFSGVVGEDLQRVLAAVATQPEGARIVAAPTGLRVGDRVVALSEGVSLVSADTGFGRVCVTLGVVGSYLGGMDSLLAPLQPRPDAICTTDLVAISTALVVGGADSGVTMTVSAIDAVGLVPPAVEPGLEDDVTLRGREILDGAQSADQAILGASAARITSYLDDIYAAGAIASVTTQEETAVWAIDGPSGTLYLSDNLRWEAFERSADGWCMRLLWNDRTATASGGVSPPSC